MREVKQKLNARKQIDPKDTFRWTTPDLKVKAKKTTLAAPQYKSNGIAKALEAINGGVSSYVDVQTSLAKQNAQKAKADYGDGERERPSGFFNLGAGYEDAWDTLDYQTRATQFSGAYMEALKEEGFRNEGHSAEESSAARRELHDEMYGQIFEGANDSDAGKAAVASSLQGVWLEGELQAQGKRHEMNIAKAKEGQVVRFTAGIDHSRFDVNVMQQIADAQWDDMKLLGLGGTVFPRDTHSQTIIDAVGAKGLEILNDPRETLDSKQRKIQALRAFLKTGGSDGNTWYDAQKGAEGGYKFKGGIDKYLGAFDSAMVAADKANSERVSKELIIGSAGIPSHDVLSAEAFRNQVLQNKDHVSASLLDTLLTSTDKIIDGEGFPEESDQSTLIALDQAAFLDTLTPEQVTDALNSHQLSVEDHRKYLSKLGEQSPERTRLRAKHVQNFKDIRADMGRVVYQESFMGSVDTEGPRRKALFNRYFMEWAMEFEEENGKEPGYTEMSDAGYKIAEMHSAANFKKFQEDPEGAMGQVFNGIDLTDHNTGGEARKEKKPTVGYTVLEESENE